MPHVTEEVWTYMPGPPESLLAVSEWPEPGRSLVDEEAEEAVGRVIAAVTELRRYREEAGAKPSAVLPARLAADGYEASTEMEAPRLPSERSPLRQWREFAWSGSQPTGCDRLSGLAMFRLRRARLLGPPSLPSLPTSRATVVT